MFRRCPRHWYYRYEALLTPMGQEASYFRTGNLVHKFLEWYHSGPKDARGSPVDWLRAENPALDGDEFEKYRQLLEGYALWDAKHPLSIERMVPEVPFVTPLPGGLALSGRIDGYVLNADGTVSLVEHKTTAKLDARYFSKLVPDTQIHYYAYALSCNPALQGRPVVSVIYNVLSSTPPAEPKLLKDGSLSRKQGLKTTPEIFRDRLARLGLSEEDYADVLRDLEEAKETTFYARQEYVFLPERVEAAYQDMLRGAAAIAAHRGITDLRVLHPNQDDCESYGGCPYRSVCHAELLGHDSTDQRLYFRQRQARHSEVGDQPLVFDAPSSFHTGVQ